MSSRAQQAMTCSRAPQATTRLMAAAAMTPWPAARVMMSISPTAQRAMPPPRPQVAEQIRSRQPSPASICRAATGSMSKTSPIPAPAISRAQVRPPITASRATPETIRSMVVPAMIRSPAARAMIPSQARTAPTPSSAAPAMTRWMAGRALTPWRAARAMTPISSIAPAMSSSKRSMKARQTRSRRAPLPTRCRTISRT